MLVIKRAFPLLLCMLLCAAVLPLGAAAASGPPFISLSAETAAPGEEVSVSVELTENPGLMVMQFSISYDHSALELIGAAGVGITGWNANGDNILWLGDADSSFNGTILRLNFRVKESAPAGETPVTLLCGSGEMGNHNEEAFVPLITAGSVIITGSASSGSSTGSEMSGSGDSDPSLPESGGPSAPGGASTPKIPFTDVPLSSYYFTAVAWAYENEITDGRGIDTFDPAGTCNRGEAVTFLWRAAGRPEPTSSDNVFEDVRPEDYFFKPVLWAVEKGIIFGTDETHFSPKQTCSTAHIITMIYRALGIGPDGWYQEAGDWANGSGLLNGTGLLVDPAENCPRSAMVTFLYRWSQRS